MDLGPAALLCSGGGGEENNINRHLSGWSWMGTGRMGQGVLGGATGDGDWMEMPERRPISPAVVAG
jgi:hypothetical protein